MRTPISPDNVAGVLALLGLMRLTGLKARLYDDHAETDRDIEVNHLVNSASARASMMADWPEEANADWYDAMVERYSFEASSIEILHTIAALGGKSYNYDSDRPWQHSQWRLVGGQQRWLKIVRQAALDSDDIRIKQWLESERWPRTDYMSMTGLDAQSYVSAALRWSQDTSKSSQGHPVSLWLMFEGIRCHPCFYVTGRDSRTNRTPVATSGWVDYQTVRWPVWREFQTAEHITHAWHSPYVMDREDIDQPRWFFGESRGVPPAPDECVSSREAAVRIGVDEIWEAKQYFDPAPYYKRIRPGYRL